MTRSGLFKVLFAAALLPPLAGCWSAYYDARTFFASGNFASKEQLATLGVPGMPEPGSPADRADMAAVLDWQAKRTPEQCEAAKAQARAGYEVFFGDLYPLPDDPAAAEFIDKVRDDVWLAMGLLKSKYDRPRPYSRDKAVKPCLRRPGGLAYPSGHAALARAYALILSEVAPARRAEFLARADQAALNRVIGGVHHPSDIEAGKLLAEALYEEALADPEFRRGLDAMRARPGRPAGQ
ncbi:MAG: phosphatase PAP2 family protein [Elusimicrobiales bacterium]|nr:phosphatase PAP2 family protein [Elusimicrobiales bacterium]